MSHLWPSLLLLEEIVKLLMSKMYWHNEALCWVFEGIKVGKHQILNRRFLHHRQYRNSDFVLTSISKKSFTSTVNTASFFITGKNTNIIFCWWVQISDEPLPSTGCKYLQARTIFWLWNTRSITDNDAILFIFLRRIPGERQWWCTSWWDFDVQWRTAWSWKIKPMFVLKSI